MEQLTIDQWVANQNANGDGGCPCDGHPIDKCETCRGACGCHWRLSDVATRSMAQETDFYERECGQ